MNRAIPNVVIGSGPAGVSASMALLHRGENVIMVDSGISLEDDRSRVLSKLSAKPESDWSPHDLEFLKGATTVSARKLPEKRSYGSNYSYRWIDPSCELIQNETECMGSFALGGLSNVWGANAVIPTQNEFSDWPLTLNDLLPYFKKVMEFIPIASNDIGKDAPAHGKIITQTMSASLQARHLTAIWNENRCRLSSAGIHSETSSLAVNSAQCTLCGLCLYGCPHNLIYSSKSTVLNQLISHPNFSYLGGKVVHRIKTNTTGVQIDYLSVGSEVQGTLTAKKLFLACGPLQTSRLVLKALEAWDHTIEAADSLYFLVPFLSFNRVKGVTRERLHTLSQASLRIEVPPGATKDAHILLYTYNDLLQKLLPPFPSLVKELTSRVTNLGFEHLCIMQGYLHSDDSPKIKIKIEKNDTRDRLFVSAEKNNSSTNIAKNILKHMNSNRRLLGGFAPPFLTQKGKPGKSYHLGGTFPMRNDPSALQTDRYGRLKELENVHLVDASVFPSVFAMNPTLTIMANAYRIASTVE
jgi:choline dehydrogenase-like flavoprotein